MFFPTFSRNRSILAGVFVLCLAGNLIGDATNPAAADDRPNVLIILVDDLGLHDLSIEGSTFYQTPHIDALARGGMRFTQGYANCRVCSPSRASIQLGTFTARHGITQWIGGKSGTDYNRNDPLLPADYVRALPAEQTTIAEAMKSAGYQTFFAGKWHLGGEGSLPTDHGYDINIGGHDRGSPPGGFFAPYKNPKMEDGPAGESLTLRLARETSDYIEGVGQEDPPFMAMLAFYTVHAPVQTTETLWKKYRDLAPPAPADGQRFKIDRTLPVRQVQDHPVYAGMIETMDNAVGMVMAALEGSGHLEDTVVVFTSDNGGVSSGDAYATCNLPLRGGKGRQWEGGVREPYYIHYPRAVPAGGTSDVPVTGADLYPTLLDLCGLDLLPEQHVDGRSLLPLLTDSATPAQEAALRDRPLVWHYPHYDNQGGEPSSLLRLGDYKLIHYHLNGRNELFHLPSDPSEQRDLAIEQPERAGQMAKQLLEFLGGLDARFPDFDPRFDPLQGSLKWQRIHGKNKENLERNHAAMLREDWQPNPNWWGSTVD
ncbi:MAG: sulfatase [Planctomycetota bacterium]